MIWTSRIALIAYLLGGWLLPAIHHHADHQHGACQHVAATSPSSESDHGCCGHSHDHQHESDEASDESASDLQITSAAKLRTCDGLCALCSARSLTSTTLKQKLTSLAGGDSCLIVHPIELDILPDSATGAHLTRGPPEIA